MPSSKSNKIAGISLLAVSALFLFGAGRLIMLRYEAGDVYAPYSTFRSDPLGTKAFYESLEEIPGVVVRRNVTRLSDLAGNRPLTLFVLGADYGEAGWRPASIPGNVPPDEVDEYLDALSPDPDMAPLPLVLDIERVLHAGGRVVFAFRPTGQDERAWRDEALQKWREQKQRLEQEGKRLSERGRGEARDAEDEEESKKELEEGPAHFRSEFERSISETATNDDERGDDTVATEDEDSEGRTRADRLRAEHGLIFQELSIADRWGISLQFDPLHQSDEFGYLPESAEALEGFELPSPIEVHTSLYFDTRDAAWRIVYERDRRAVVVERPFGEGTLVFAADSYWFSNEAMRVDRHPELLAWFIGPHREIVFDETLLGIQERPGIMGLVREYNLEGVVAAVFVLGLLFVWRQAASLVPPLPTDPKLPAEVTEGRDAAAGFANLLRRSISQRRLLEVCLEEWKRTFAHRLSEAPSVVGQLEAIVSTEKLKRRTERDPVSAYRAMCDVIAKERRFGR